MEWSYAYSLSQLKRCSNLKRIKKILDWKVSNLVVPFFYQRDIEIYLGTHRSISSINMRFYEYS